MKNTTSEEEYHVNPVLKQLVGPDTDLKNWLVEYVGAHLSPDNMDVTVEMIVEVVAAEFPEFLLAVAEENYIRGYEQALDDLNEAQQIQNE
tara:strand:- start:18755 stop:19027 length:273 start_codon:yes stop_codon:yes gene_type:complete